MDLLFTICARAGSKGAPGKNTRDFCGMPLAAYTVAAYSLFCERHGQRANHVRLAVNTDSDLLRRQVEGCGREHLFIPREPALAGDVVAKKDVIADTLRKSEERTGRTFDAVIDLDLTSPLRTADDIWGTLAELLADREADIAYSVTHARRPPCFSMVCKKEDGYFDRVIPSDITARQQAPDYYDMNGSIYAYRRGYLLDPSIVRRKERIWVMEDTGVLDIDGEEDFALMEVVAGHFFQKEGYGEVRDRARALWNA